MTVIVAPVSKARWHSICTDCAGAIDSLVELLQGRFSQGVMERICQQRSGLFPSPEEIDLSCSCPDWAEMCKHVAAVLYGVGARLDQQPELLFQLHKIDAMELIAKAGDELPLSKNRPAAAKVLGEGEDLSALFGLDIAQNTKPSKKPVDGLPPKLKQSRIESTKKKPLKKTAAKKTGGDDEKKSGVKTTSGVKKTRKTRQRKLTPAARRKMAEAARARWQARKMKIEEQAGKEIPVTKRTALKPAKGGSAAAGRKRLSELAKVHRAEQGKKAAKKD